MIRVVRGADTRTWTVRSRISWTTPPMAEHFEHDMAAGYVSAVAMIGVVAVLTLFVVFWTPADVVIPAWFVLLILLILLLLAVIWATQRPWIITADTAEPAGTGGEHWEGTVPGWSPARETTYRIIHELRDRGIPDDGTGPITRVSPTTSPRDG